MIKPNIRPIETFYKGYRFRSRLEARWAVFFDMCGLKWEYEPEGYYLPDGSMYLPDFKIHGVDGRDGGDLYVEVKGEMNDVDARKINSFVKAGYPNVEGIYTKSSTATLVVGNIPVGDCMDDITSYIEDEAYSHRGDKAWWPNYYNFETIDGDYFAAHPGINREGKFELFGDDSNYLQYMDQVATERAYRVARQARFEHGETPIIMTGGK